MKKLWLILVLCLLPVMALGEGAANPVDWRILGTDTMENMLIALIEAADGERVLYVHTHDITTNTYTTRRTAPLPEDAALDIAHAGEGQIELYGRDWRFTYALQPDGGFLLESVSDADSWRYVNFCGLESLETNRLQIGTVPGYDLFQADLPALAGSVPEPDRTGWAVVSAAEGLPLYAQASEASSSLGTFFRGTPVRVLEEAGDWLRVMIGTDGRLSGWMQRSGLTFGSAMDDVENRFPDLQYIEAFHGQRPLYTSADMTECVEASTQRYWMMVVGEVEEELYILLYRWGESGYVPKDWLFPGNG